MQCHDGPRILVIEDDAPLRDLDRHWYFEASPTIVQGSYLIWKPLRVPTDEGPEGADCSLGPLLHRLRRKVVLQVSPAMRG